MRVECKEGGKARLTCQNVPFRCFGASDLVTRYLAGEAQSGRVCGPKGGVVLGGWSLQRPMTAPLLGAEERPRPVTK
jgi:hypothetical protein